MQKYGLLYFISFLNNIINYLFSHYIYFYCFTTIFFTIFLQVQNIFLVTQIVFFVLTFYKSVQSLKWQISCDLKRSDEFRSQHAVLYIWLDQNNSE